MVAVAQFGSPIGLAVRRGGGSVYVTNSGNGSVSQFDVGVDGALIPKSPPTVAAGDGPEAVAVNPDGRSVYVTNFSSDTVSQYDVGVDGTLTPKSPPTVTAGNGPVDVAVSPFASNLPPDCSGVQANPSTFSRATRRLATVALTGASDPNGDAFSFYIDGVSQDEPVSGSGDSTFPDAALTSEGADSNQVEVRAERNKRGNGRVYRIAFTVSDDHGASCSGSAADTNAKVSVPLRRGRTTVDDAPPSYDSFTGAPLP
jgi:hypothetical protein